MGSEFLDPFVDAFMVWTLTTLTSSSKLCLHSNDGIRLNICFYAKRLFFISPGPLVRQTPLDDQVEIPLPRRDVKCFIMTLM